MLLNNLFVTLFMVGSAVAWKFPGMLYNSAHLQMKIKQNADQESKSFILQKYIPVNLGTAQLFVQMERMSCLSLSPSLIC
jgi:hypothetical protein